MKSAVWTQCGTRGSHRSVYLTRGGVTYKGSGHAHALAQFGEQCCKLTEIVTKIKIVNLH